jgi:hypothetical protein
VALPVETVVSVGQAPAAQPVPWIRALLGGRGGERGELLELPDQDRPDELAVVGEVQVEGRCGDTGLAGDGAQAHRLRRLMSEEVGAAEP